MLSLENVSFGFSDKASGSGSGVGRRSSSGASKKLAVNDFSLSVEDGSFTTLLGPSGCGKTTILRLIAGFLKPDSGEIKIDGVLQNGISPSERKIAFVFQDYALFPHLTVEKNLLYGLKNLGVGKVEANGLIHQTSRILAIEGLLDRFPHQLSGGQQQRVALGRALVLKPKILLMDEPLSSLDAKLRILVRTELREIQRQLKITTVYVTHDREEAFSISDKIAVINHGKLQQYGTPREIYFSPENRFTADFAGIANFFEDNSGPSTGSGTEMARPEWVEIEKVIELVEMTGEIISVEFLGQFSRFRIKTPAVQGGILVCDRVDDGSDFKVGDKVSFSLKKTVFIV